MDLLVEFPSNPGGSSHQRPSRGHRPERRGRSGELMPFLRPPPAARSRPGSNSAAIRPLQKPMRSNAGSI